MKRPAKEITPKEAQARLEELCARSEHSTGEMAEKLRKWKISGDEAERIIAALVKNRFVDDRRFALAYTNDKIKMARWGKRKVLQGLYAKRVASEIIKEVLSEIDQSVYEENLRSVIAQKIKTAPQLLESYEGRTKIFRFIISRGYEPQLGAQFLREYLKNYTPANS